MLTSECDVTCGQYCNIAVSYCNIFINVTNLKLHLTLYYHIEYKDNVNSYLLVKILYVCVCDLNFFAFCLGISCSSSESTTTIVIACVVTLLVSVTVTAIVSSVTTYMLMKRRNENTPQDTSDKVLYEQVHSPSPSITKNNPQCQKNPAYDVGGKMAVDMAPTYESCK